VIFLIGDMTGLTRPQRAQHHAPSMTREEIAHNAETYKAQVFKILDRDKTEVRSTASGLRDEVDRHHQNCSRNTPWRESWSATIFPSASKTARPSRSMNSCTVLRRGRFVALQCDVELGGTDQKFNCWWAASCSRLRHRRRFVATRLCSKARRRRKNVRSRRELHRHQ